ncbi:MAG: hypothetical protein KDC48_11480 [Planctomycetes bacterium]|nr:hypothetical protein [Planctomycetota bacterium]
MSCGWGLAAAREVPSQSATLLEGGWLAVGVDAARPAGSGLIVAAPAHLSAFVGAEDVSVRHEVVLEHVGSIDVMVRDVSTFAPAADVVVVVSAMPMAREVEQEPDVPTVTPSLPGPDVHTAIYRARADEHGRCRLGLPTPAGEMHLQVLHRWYLMAVEQSDRVQFVRGVSNRIDVQMPAVGAVRYVGDALVQAQMATRISQGEPMREVMRLQALHRRLRGEDESVAAVALLPPANGFQWGREKARADVLLKKGGARRDEVNLVRLSDYAGPVSIDAGDVGHVTRVARVRLVLADPERFALADPALQVMVSGRLEKGGHFAPVFARVGDVVDLPAGSYRVTGGRGAESAFELQTYEVTEAKDTEFVIRWREDVLCYRIAIEGAPEVELAQFKVERDGRHYVFDVARDRDGAAVFWSKRSCDHMEVFLRGWLQVPVVVVRDLKTGMMRGSCAVTTRR